MTPFRPTSINLVSNIYRVLEILVYGKGILLHVVIYIDGIVTTNDMVYDQFNGNRAACFVRMYAEINNRWIVRNLCGDIIVETSRTFNERITFITIERGPPSGESSE